MLGCTITKMFYSMRLKIQSGQFYAISYIGGKIWANTKDMSTCFSGFLLTFFKVLRVWDYGTQVQGEHITASSMITSKQRRWIRTLTLKSKQIAKTQLTGIQYFVNPLLTLSINSFSCGWMKPKFLSALLLNIKTEKLHLHP